MEFGHVDTWMRQTVNRGLSQHRQEGAKAGTLRETADFLCLQRRAELGEELGQVMGSCACWVVECEPRVPAVGSYGWILSWGAAAVD